MSERFRAERFRAVVAVDPGYKQSAIVQMAQFATGGSRWPTILRHGIYPNEDARRILADLSWLGNIMALEKVAMGGQVAGPETFETCVWSGRFVELWQPHAYCRIPRVSVKKHLTGKANTKDAHVRQAIIERFGGDKATAVGVKATPGPLYGVRADVWAAIAVGLTYLEADDEFDENGKVDAHG